MLTEFEFRNIPVNKVNVVQIWVKLAIFFNESLDEIDCHYMLGLLRQNHSKAAVSKPQLSLALRI